MDSLTFKIHGEKKEIFNFDTTWATIEDEPNGAYCMLTLKQKVTGEIILKAYNVEYWYIKRGVRSRRS